MKYNKIDDKTIKLTIGIPNNSEVINLGDKFLFDNGKTVGFRKDKQTNKFVGLRQGYSKQLEFSLESIVIDGTEKIIKNKKFSSIKSNDNIIIHKINGIEIHNKVDSSYYKSMVKIIEVCDDVDIIFKINLKGFKILNKSYISNEKIVYLENKDEQFIIVDEGNNISNFIIDKPIVYTDDYKSLSVVQHELYLIDDELFYKKSVRNLSYYLNDIITLPLLIDANIRLSNSIYHSINKIGTDILLTNNIVKNHIDWFSFVNDYETGNYNRISNDVNLLNNSLSTISINSELYNYAPYVKLSRHFFSFDTSVLGNRGIINVTNAYFNFNYDTNTLPINLTLKKATFGGNIPSTNNWNSYIGNPYNIKDTIVNYFDKTSILDVPPNDIIIGGVSNFILSLNDFDNLSATSIPQHQLNLISNSYFKDSSLDIYFDIYIDKKQKVEFDIINDNTFGVLQSKGVAYDDVLSGTTSTITKVHSSSIGTFDSAFGYSFDVSFEKNNLYRTFFTFDTSFLNFYNDIVVRSASLKFTSYKTINSSVSLYQKNSNILPISIDETSLSWNMKSSTDYNYNGNYVVNNVGIETIITLDISGITSGTYNSFILTDYYHDYMENSDIIGQHEYFNGIDFNTVKLVVDIEPYLIQGIEYKQIKEGKTFDLFASMNVDNTSFKIKWFSDNLLTNILGIGTMITLDSNLFKTNDVIHAAIYNNDIKVSINTLNISLETISETFNTLPIDNRITSYDVVNLDSIYFKYQSSINGICYSYARDLDNIYENNNSVSDGDDLGSYNMYNEYDIISEFFNNSKDVDVVARMEDINLKLSYKQIDNQTIHQGTRVLLYSITPSENDGVYVADYNLKLIKNNETNTSEKSFRYKVNVKFGTYLDYEFHTYYYDNLVDNILPSDPLFDFDIFDSSLYSDIVIDMGSYYDRIFDSNI